MARCNYGGQLEDALCDRFVCGVRNESIQRRLLSEAELDLAKEVKLATAMEAAHSNAQTVRSSSIAVGK